MTGFGRIRRPKTAYKQASCHICKLILHPTTSRMSSKGKLITKIEAADVRIGHYILWPTVCQHLS